MTKDKKSRIDYDALFTQIKPTMALKTKQQFLRINPKPVEQQKLA
jgi:hypothetical protein